MFKNKRLLVITSFIILVLGLTAGVIYSKSINKKEKINIAYSTDENYIYPTIVSMTSLMENADKNTKCNFTVLLSEGISQEEKNKFKTLEKNYSNCSVNLVDMGEKFGKSELKCWSRAMYYRLNLPEILKDEKKCLYIDGDTIIRHDLKEMYNTDMTDYYVAGIRDMNTTVNEESKHYEVLGIKDLSTYICSGVLLMNLEKLRNDNMSAVFEELVEKNDKEKVFHFPDQDIINKACYGHILPLAFKYGALFHTNFSKPYEESDYAKWASNEKDWEEGRKDPTIVHFTGPKPWTNIRSNFCKEWWQYADKTDFKNEINTVYHPIDETK